MKLIIVYNRCYNKNYLNNLIIWIFKNYDFIRILNLLERVKYLGFQINVKIGISSNRKNLIITQEKRCITYISENIKIERKIFKSYIKRIYFY